MINDILKERLAHNYPAMISHPPGWDEIVQRLHDKLVEIVPEYQIFQTKEKFGGLRFYGEFPKELDKTILREQVFRIIREAEAESYRTCQNCGRPGRTRHEGWSCTLCDRCQALREGLDIVTWEGEGGLAIED